jgi:hypothetical protein
MTFSEGLSCNVPEPGHMSKFDRLLAARCGAHQIPGSGSGTARRVGRSGR